MIEKCLYTIPYLRFTLTAFTTESTNKDQAKPKSLQLLSKYKCRSLLRFLLFQIVGVKTQKIWFYPLYLSSFIAITRCC